MNPEEELELLLKVLREQPLPKNGSNPNQQNILKLDDKTLKKLTDMVEVRSVNFSVEEKLDKIIELLEKLVPQPVVLNTPITVKSEDDNNVGIDINKSLYELVNKVEKRQKSVGIGQEDFIKRLNEIDWDKLVNSFGVLPDNSLENQVKKNLLPKVLVENERKRKSSIFTPDGKQFWVFKKKKEKFVKVGTAEIVGEPPIVRITFLTDYKKEYIGNPSSYEYGFWTMTDYGGSSWLGYQKNLLESYQFKYNFTELPSPEGVTGYLTDEGRVVYYDQYLE